MPNFRTTLNIVHNLNIDKKNLAKKTMMGKVF